MCELAQFLQLRLAPLQPFFSLPVELMDRQRHSQERIHKLAVHNFSYDLSWPNGMIIPGDRGYQSQRG